MKKCAFIALALLLGGCASNPYGTGENQGYFLGSAEITSNVPNLCEATGGQYAFQAQQYWLAGGSATVWYGCTASHHSNLQPQYMIDYSIIKNDGTGQNIVSTCTPIYPGKGDGVHYTKMNLVVQLKEGTPSCQAILS